MGERLNITLDKGIRRSPSLGEDGDLSECINMIPRGGELVPIAPPVQAGGFKKDAQGNWPTDKLVAIHSTDNTTIYICIHVSGSEISLYSSTTLTNMELTQSNLIETLPISRGMYYGVRTMGRMLMVMTANGIYYYLYKPEDNKYKALGSHIPEIGISFGLTLDTEMYQSEGKDDTGGENPPMDDYYLMGNNMKVKTNFVLPGVRNKAIKESMDKGYFAMPFMVRYALQLNDGTSVIYPSAPVLMVPCTDNPFCYVRKYSASVDGQFRALVIRGKLDMQLKDDAQTIYENWKDVVRGVNVYVSAPMYTYDQSHEFEYWKSLYGTKDPDTHQQIEPSDTQEINAQGGICFGKANGVYQNMTALEVYLRSGATSETNAMYSNAFNGASCHIKNPARSIEDDVKDCMNYYLLKSFSLDELSEYTTRKEVQIAEGRITNIISQPRLKGNMSHDTLAPSVAYVYNQRLHIANCIRYTTNPLPLWAMVQYLEKSGRRYKIELASNGQQTKTTRYSNYTADAEAKDQRVKMTINGRNAVLENSDKRINVLIDHLQYIAFSAKDAERLYIEGEDDINHVELTNSDTVDVSYAFNNLEDIDLIEDEDIPSVEGGITDEGFVYTSESGYPFSFDEDTQSAVGNGRILAMSSATKAITEGQFGQFPMLLFTTEGIWAMSVNQDGTMSAPQPISRDVCNNPDAITQTDSEVIFTTDRGLLAVSGQNVRLLSAFMEGKNLSEDALHLGTLLNNTAWSSMSVDDSDDIREALLNAVTLYDYANRLIHVFRNGSTKHYAISMDDGQWASEVWGGVYANWGASNSTITSIPAYPAGYVQVNGDIYQYNQKAYNTTHPAMIITRPIAFGDLYAHKTLEDVRVYRDTETCKLLLFASNDGKNWLRLTSLHGMAFKFFRIGILATVGFGSSLSGIATLFHFRRRNKLR